MTAASTIVSAGMLPINLLIYINLAYQESGAANNLDWASLFISIGVVITAILLGLAVSNYSSEKVNVVNILFNVISLLGDVNFQIQKRCALFGNLAGLSLIFFSGMLISKHTVVVCDIVLDCIY